MQRVPSVDPQQAHGRTRELLEKVNQTFGVIPNAAKVMANSAAVLDGFLALTSAMANAKIGEKLHHQAKLAVSEMNACDYCTAILCAIGPNAGLTAADLVEGRLARAEDARTDAALKFAKAVLETQGKVSEENLRAVRQAGFGDAEIVEIVAGMDMFYLGTANAQGQPYIQYRGGPPGFLKVLDDQTLGFADFGGNRQYITLGNLSENPRAFIFLMDYANSRRVKVWRSRLREDPDSPPKK